MLMEQMKLRRSPRQIEGMEHIVDLPPPPRFDPPACTMLTPDPQEGSLLTVEVVSVMNNNTVLLTMLLYQGNLICARRMHPSSSL